MRMPVNYVAVTQGFKKGKHNGVDFGYYSNAHKYQPVFAIDDGEVIAIPTQTSGGKVVQIKHSNGYVSEYAHLDSRSVKKGDKVQKGQQIGKMGNSGNTTGMHLHLGLYKGTKINYNVNNFVDPLKYMNLYKNQTVNLKSTLLYTIKKTKTVKGVPSEPLLIRDSKNVIVGKLKNGQECEYYSKSGARAVTDNLRNYTTAVKYLK